MQGCCRRNGRSGLRLFAVTPARCVAPSLPVARHCWRCMRWNVQHWCCADAALACLSDWEAVILVRLVSTLVASAGDALVAMHQYPLTDRNRIRVSFAKIPAQGGAGAGPAGQQY